MLCACHRLSPLPRAALRALLSVCSGERCDHLTACWGGAQFPRPPEGGSTVHPPQQWRPKARQEAGACPMEVTAVASRWSQDVSPSPSLTTENPSLPPRTAVRPTSQPLRPPSCLQCACLTSGQLPEARAGAGGLPAHRGLSAGPAPSCASLAVSPVAGHSQHCLQPHRWAPRNAPPHPKLTEFQASPTWTAPCISPRGTWTGFIRPSSGSWLPGP